MSSFVFLLLTICAVFVIDLSVACIGSGVCGGGGGCCGGGCAPPPVSCGSCSPGYGCGRFGCAKLRRARARGANTLGDSVRNRFLQLPRDPNQLFRECCEDRGLPDSCISKCNFNTYTKEALMAMFFKTDGCPVEAAAELQFCAAQGRDHRPCCVRNGVHTTMAGEKCLTFCDQRPGNVTQLDFSYSACYDRFENMKACFVSDINYRLSV